MNSKLDRKNHKYFRNYTLDGWTVDWIGFAAEWLYKNWTAQQLVSFD